MDSGTCAHGTGRAKARQAPAGEIMAAAVKDHPSRAGRSAGAGFPVYVGPEGLGTDPPLVVGGEDEASLRDQILAIALRDYPGRSRQDAPGRAAGRLRRRAPPSPQRRRPHPATLQAPDALSPQEPAQTLPSSVRRQGIARAMSPRAGRCPAWSLTRSPGVMPSSRVS